HQHARRLLELTVCRKRHPECAEVVRSDVLSVRHNQAFLLRSPVSMRPTLGLCDTSVLRNFLTGWTNVSTARQAVKGILAHMRAPNRVPRTKRNWSSELVHRRV